MGTTLSNPVFADVEVAADRISAFCIETPLLESPFVNARLGGRLLLKAENLQITGSFKLRGATNRLMAMDLAERKRGVVARSSGNHGLGIAYAAAKLGVNAVVIVPPSAPRAKTNRIRDFGATILVADPADYAAKANELVERDGRTFIPPADDFWVIAGAGTVGLEIMQQTRRLDISLDDLLVCCSGGGLTAGCWLAANALSPETRIHAVEAVGFDKMARSIAAGYRIDNPPGGKTICDALSGPYTAQIPFNMIEKKLACTLAVTDEDVRQAMRIAYSEFGIAAEPGGVAALAAILSGAFPIKGKIVAVTISGGNVDLRLAGEILAADQAPI